jgi:hypothetical protein
MRQNRSVGVTAPELRQKEVNSVTVNEHFSRYGATPISRNPTELGKLIELGDVMSSVILYPDHINSFGSTECPSMHGHIQSKQVFHNTASNYHVAQRAELLWLTREQVSIQLINIRQNQAYLTTD